MIEEDAAAALVLAAEGLFGSGVMSASGHANLSARVGREQMLITAQGTVRGLRASQLALVNLEGEVVRGSLDPIMREIVGMHATVYRQRDSAGAVIHAHSPGLLAFAMANRELPCRYEALLRFGQAEPVPVVPWAPRGSSRSVEGIAEALDRSAGTMAVLLGNHGVLAFGPDPAGAGALLVVLEEAARGELAAVGLGGSRDFPEGALEEVLQAMARARQ
jgi:L-ribulose-5-phosphate 4-epimerase